MRRALWCATMVWLLQAVATAQGFGKNKIQYRPLRWAVHRTEHLNVHYYPEASDRVAVVARFAEAAYVRIAEDLGLREPADERQKRRVPLVLYLNRRHFGQTFIYPGFLGEGVRGFSEPMRGRMVIPLDGPRRDLEELIVHEMTHLLTYRAMGDSTLSRQLSSLPLWFLEGLAEHETGTWAALDEGMLRDATLRGLIVPTSGLEGFDGLREPFLGYVIGHAAVDLLVERFGRRVLGQILQELRLEVRKSLPRAIFRATSWTPEQLDHELHRSLIRRFGGPEAGPGFEDRSEPWPSPEKRMVSVGAAVSPAGELVAHFTNERGTLELAVDRVVDGGRFARVAEAGGRHDSIGTEGRPIAWSPDGELVAFAAERGGRDVLVLWSLAQGGERERLDVGLDRMWSPGFHPDGSRIALAGAVGGAQDLYLVDLKSGQATALTKDEWFDTEPAWSGDGSRLVYSSERRGRYQLVLLDPASGQERVLLTGSGAPFQAAWTRQGRLLCIWDRSGVENVYQVDPASGEATRLTDVVGRSGWPCELPDGRISYGEYRAGYFGLRTLPVKRHALEVVLDRPLELPAVGVAGSEPGTVPQGLEPSLELGLKDVDWGLAWTEDQRLLLGAGLTLGDLFNERQLTLQVGSDNLLESVSVGWSTLRRRVELGASAGHRRRHVHFEGDRQRQSEQWARLTGVYAFDRELRLEANLQAARTRNSEPFGVYGTEPRNALLLSAALVGDRVRYSAVGPLSGTRFRLEALTSLPAGSLVSQHAVEADLRAYGRWLRRWVLAGRLAGGVSLGEDPVYFGLGGAESLRGLELGELTGENYFLGNVELRFPLVDYIGLGTGWGLSGLRGAVFVDAGAAFDEFGEVELFETEPEWRLLDLKANLGVRASLRVAGLDLRVSAGWRTDVATFDDTPNVTFTVGSGPLF